MKILDFGNINEKQNIQLADFLADLSVKAREGKLGELVMFYVDEEGEYSSYCHCTKMEAISMTALAHAAAIDKMRA